MEALRAQLERRKKQREDASTDSLVGSVWNGARWLRVCGIGRGHRDVTRGGVDTQSGLSGH